MSQVKNKSKLALQKKKEKRRSRACLFFSTMLCKAAYFNYSFIIV